MKTGENNNNLTIFLKSLLQYHLCFLPLPPIGKVRHVHKGEPSMFMIPHISAAMRLEGGDNPIGKKIIKTLTLFALLVLELLKPSHWHGYEHI